MRHAISWREGIQTGAVSTAIRRDVMTRNQSELPRTIWNRLKIYLRRDFHPNEIGDLALAQQRLAEVGLEDKPAASIAGA